MTFDPSVGVLVLATLSLGALAAAAVVKEPPDLPKVAELPARAELPDPLVMLDGRRITTREQWERERRPELKRLFQHYMYGPLLPAPKDLRAKVEREDVHALGGKATLREVTLPLDADGKTAIHLLLVTPNAAPKPAPVFLGLNFCGNHAVLRDPGIRLPTAWMYAHYSGVVENRATEAGRGSQADVWNIEWAIDRGYALATFYNGDVDPDRADVAEGIHASLVPAGQTARAQDRGTVAAWAWGLQRAVDYLVTAPGLDPKRIAVVGHSRNGKAALVAAAFDERIALAIPHQAGCGGTAPSRSRVGESVKQINTAFPHWFNAAFKEFNDQPERLPFDQHALVALMAPRPVLLSNAVEDEWANPNGQFEMLRAADPVFRLLGVEGLTERERPPVGKLIDGRLGYFMRPGKHSMNTQDWEAFLAFADRHFGAAMSK